MRRRGRRERGTAIIEFSWLAILLMLPLVYGLIALFDVQREAYGASAAARAATRAFLVAPTGDPAEGRERAYEAASLAMADQHASLTPDDFSLDCSADCYSIGSTVRVEVRTEVELPLLPHVFGPNQPAVHVAAEDTEPYGSYRETR